MCLLFQSCVRTSMDHILRSSESPSLLARPFVSLVSFVSFVSFVLTSFLLFFQSSNTLLWTLALVLEGRFSIFYRICMKRAPWSGFMRKSASMSCMGQNATFTWPFLIWSVTKTYLKSRWWILLLLEVLPFSASRIVLLLSWYRVVMVTNSPCTATKWCVYNNCPMALSIATNSVSVELFVFSFCLQSRCR